MKHSPICYIAGALPLPKNCTLHPEAGDFIIAADGGHTQLAQIGTTPHLVVGDFDSSTPPTDHSHVITLPVEKDDTDVGYAIRLGRERGYTNFVLLGCFGGLFDHTMANFQHLHALSAAGCTPLMVGDDQRATVLTEGTLTLAGTQGNRCSIFALGGAAKGVTLKNLHYTLQNGPLSPTVPLGVSNSFTHQPAEITVNSGSLLVIWEDSTTDITPFFSHKEE